MSSGIGTNPGMSSGLSSGLSSAFLSRIGSDSSGFSVVGSDSGTRLIGTRIGIIVTTVVPTIGSGWLDSGWLDTGWLDAGWLDSCWLDAGWLAGATIIPLVQKAPILG